ncbi:MAG: PKD-like family lipoprotein [Marinifilaceae bacterium]
MKNKLYLLLMQLSFIAIVGCYSDLGSYEYKDINEIGIEFDTMQSNLRFMIDTLKITPVLNFTLDETKNPDRYSYEWKVELNNYSTNPPKYLLSTERNLAYHVALQPENYKLYFKVLDKETGVQWMKTEYFTVNTAQGRGYYLLGEDKEGNAALDMIVLSLDTLVAKDLLKNSGLPTLKRPLRVMWSGDGRSQFDAWRKLWITTEDGSYYIDQDSYEGDINNTFNSILYTSFDLPSNMLPYDMATKTNTGTGNMARAVVTNTGHLFAVKLFEGEYYKNPLNRYTSLSTEFFEAYPYIFSTIGNFNSYLIYDVDNQRFVSYSMFSENGTVLKDNAGDIFPWNQTNRTLVMGANTMNTDGNASYGNSFALMKDADNNYFVYKFYASGSKKGNYVMSSEVNALLPHAKNIMFSSNRTLMLFSIGKTLYAYDYNPGYEKVYSIEMEDEITFMKFDIETNTTYREFYIATYNDEKRGMLQKYIIDSDHNTFQIKADEKCYWDGLVKVVDMDWRNSK